MPTNYPSNLDTWPTIGPLLSSTPHSDVHEDLQDAVEAIQTELGTNPSGPAATVRANLEQLRRTYANVGALPPSGEFVGQTAWVQDIARQYSWDGTYWRITGGTFPACRLYRDSGHQQAGSAGTVFQLSGHSGVSGGFRTTNILTIPAGAGGVYQLDFGAEYTQGAAFGFSVGVLIANNDGIVDTLSPTQLVAAAEYEGIGAFPVFPVVNLSKVMAFAAGATITFSGLSTAGATRGPVSSYIGLTMLHHRPEWA
jgi:hypothetical protein